MDQEEGRIVGTIPNWGQQQDQSYCYIRCFSCPDHFLPQFFMDHVKIAHLNYLPYKCLHEHCFDQHPSRSMFDLHSRMKHEGVGKFFVANSEEVDAMCDSIRDHYVALFSHNFYMIPSIENAIRQNGHVINDILRTEKFRAIIRTLNDDWSKKLDRSQTKTAEQLLQRRQKDFSQKSLKIDQESPVNENVSFGSYGLETSDADQSIVDHEEYERQNIIDNVQNCSSSTSNKNPPRKSGPSRPSKKAPSSRSISPSSPPCASFGGASMKTCKKRRKKFRYTMTKKRMPDRFACQVCYKTYLSTSRRKHSVQHLPHFTDISWLYECLVCPPDPEQRCKSLYADGLMKHVKLKHKVKVPELGEHIGDRTEECDKQLNDVFEICFGNVAD